MGEMTLREEIAWMFARMRTGGSVFMDGSHGPRPSEYRRADEVIEAIERRLLGHVAVQNAAKRVGYLDRTGGPDANRYELYKPVDYAIESIAAAWDTAQGAL